MARLVLQPFEYNVCVECALDQQVRNPAFLGSYCSRHREPRLHKSSDPTIVRDRLLLFDASLPMYTIETRWKCTRSGYLFRKPGRCPLAGADAQVCDQCASKPKADALDAGEDLGSDEDEGHRQIGRLSNQPTYVWVPAPDVEAQVRMLMELQDSDGDDDSDDGNDDLSPVGEGEPAKVPAVVFSAKPLIQKGAIRVVKRGKEQGS